MTTDSASTATNVDNDTLTQIRNWSNENEAYHYNDEAIAITSDITLTRNGTNIPTVASPARLTAEPTDSTASLWELPQHDNSNRRLGTSITLDGSHGTAGVFDITITDVTPTDDFPSAPGTPASVTLTIFVVNDRAGTPATPTLEVDAENYKRDGTDFTDQQIRTPDGTANTQLQN